jgi:hypothetical protein
MVTKTEMEDKNLIRVDILSLKRRMGELEGTDVILRGTVQEVRLTPDRKSHEIILLDTSKNRTEGNPLPYLLAQLAKMDYSRPINTGNLIEINGKVNTGFNTPWTLFYANYPLINVKTYRHVMIGDRDYNLSED